MEEIPQGNPRHDDDPTRPPNPPAPPPAYGTPPAQPSPYAQGGYPMGPAGGYPGGSGGYAGGGMPRKPGKLTAVAIIMLISGIFNCIIGIMLIFGCYTVVLTPLLLTAGILEIVHASKLLKDPIDAYKPATGLAILEIVCILGCNVSSLVAGILNLVFWGDPQVQQYYRDVAIARGYQPQV